MSSQHLERVAIVGASGRIGTYFAKALVKTGKHTVTALVRPNSKGTVPDGVKSVLVDFDSDEALMDALRGQQMLVITLTVMAPPNLHEQLVTAAAQAGVPYVMPNVYCHDFLHEKLAKEDLHGADAARRTQQVEKAGAAWIAMVCGFWYEFSLTHGTKAYGFDIPNRTVTFIDDGKTAINTSTWEQCGNALAALANLPESGTSPAVADWKNRPLYISSFRVSQREMLDSLHRVLGTSDKDWTITYEPSAKRYQDGLELWKTGSIPGIIQAMYTRTFYPNGDGNYEERRGLDNDKLNLPRESLDEATKRAVAMI